MSDIVEEVKRTPMQHRQRINFIILGLVLLASGFGLGTSSTFFYLKDRIRPKIPIMPLGPGDPNERRGPRFFDPVERWAAQYNFTDEQKELAKAALERQHQAFREMFSDGQKKMEAAKDILVQDMNDILTAEQFKPWHEDFKERLKRRRRGPGGPPRNRGDGPRKEGYGSKGRDGDSPPGPPRNRGNGQHRDGYPRRDRSAPIEDSPQ